MSVIIKDHQDLEDIEKIEKIQERLLRALRIYSRNRRPKIPVIYPKLLMKLYDLRNISMRGSLNLCRIFDLMYCENMLNTI